jgi:hypothetical protein
MIASARSILSLSDSFAVDETTPINCFPFGHLHAPSGNQTVAWRSQ